MPASVLLSPLDLRKHDLVYGFPDLVFAHGAPASRFQVRLLATPGQPYQVHGTGAPASRRRPSRPRVQTAAAAKAEPEPRARIRILLADDHKMMRDALAAMLEQQPDFEVVGRAADGREAVDQVDKLRPDVLITDVSMPQMDGIEAARLITQGWPQVAVIGLTMHEGGTHHDAMRQAGAVECLVKSGSTEDLVRAIHAAVRDRRDPAEGEA